ncbi:MAG TPA: glycosyltransferase family 39 protein [Phycisphaerae bacterium]|nr:glycosyltransferase family 39 protein [Phycisphaerae bacterium]
MTTPSTRLFIALFITIAIGVAAFFSSEAVVVVAMNGGLSVAILLAALGLGRLAMALIPTPSTSPLTMWTLAAAFGTGLLSLLTLALGACGVMQRPLWLGLITLLDAVAIVCLVRAIGRRNTDMPLGPPVGSCQTHEWTRWLALAPAAFLAFGLLAATIPPGAVWRAEGNGYDVLEYHLGAPRDYFDAGRIHYLPNNIYSNFPFQVEMLYLLSMVLHGDAVAAVYTAKLVNLFLAAIAVFAIFRAGSRVSQRVGVAAGVLAGTTPFLVYLSGVAYVENGMLMFTAAALLAALGIFDDNAGATRRALLAGVLAGFAAGCKYTALPMVATPLLGYVAIKSVRTNRRFAAPAVMLAGVVIAMAPWLIRNVAATGNPVFPLGTRWLGCADGVWDAAGEQRWIEGHQPKASDSSIGHRLEKLTDQMLISKKFGPVLPIGLAAVVALSVVSRRRREPAPRTITDAPTTDGVTLRDLTVACGILMVVTLYVWLFHTHLVDRFAITLVAPSALAIAALALSDASERRVRLSVLAVGAVAIFNLGTVQRMFDLDAGEGATRVSILDLGIFGRTEWMTSADSPFYPHVAAINAVIHEGGRVLVVADAKRFYLDAGADTCVVFNRYPFADAAATRTEIELISWLSENGYTHVYVDWSEMRRLRSTYGFWDSITPELFERLSAVGLRPVQSFTRTETGPPYATLFILPTSQ